MIPWHRSMLFSFSTAKNKILNAVAKRNMHKPLIMASAGNIPHTQLAQHRSHCPRVLTSFKSLQEGCSLVEENLNMSAIMCKHSTMLCAISCNTRTEQKIPTRNQGM